MLPKVSRGERGWSGTEKELVKSKKTVACGDPYGMRWYDTFEEVHTGQCGQKGGQTGQRWGWETATAQIMQCPIHYIGILEFCLKNNVTIGFEFSGIWKLYIYITARLHIEWTHV